MVFPLVLNVLLLGLGEGGEFEGGARENDGSIMRGWTISGRRPNAVLTLVP